MLYQWKEKRKVWFWLSFSILYPLLWDESFTSKRKKRFISRSLFSLCFYTIIACPLSLRTHHFSKNIQWTTRAGLCVACKVKGRKMEHVKIKHCFLLVNVMWCDTAKRGKIREQHQPSTSMHTKWTFFHMLLQCRQRQLRWDECFLLKERMEIPLLWSYLITCPCIYLSTSGGWIEWDVCNVL